MVFSGVQKSLMVLNYCNITPDRVHVIDFFQNVIFRMIFSHLKPFSCLNFLRTFSVRFSGLPQFLIGLQYFHFHDDSCKLYFRVNKFSDIFDSTAQHDPSWVPLTSSLHGRSCLTYFCEFWGWLSHPKTRCQSNVNIFRSRVEVED